MAPFPVKPQGKYQRGRIREACMDVFEPPSLATKSARNSGTERSQMEGLMDPLGLIQKTSNDSYNLV